MSLPEAKLLAKNAFAWFLQESCGITFAQYQVYSHLMRAGYIVTRLKAAVAKASFCDTCLAFGTCWLHVLNLFNAFTEWCPPFHPPVTPLPSPCHPTAPLTAGIQLLGFGMIPSTLATWMSATT